MVTAVALTGQAAEIKQIHSLNQTAVFRQFDSRLGELNYIKIDALLNISGGTLYYDNDSESPAFGSLEFGKVVNIAYTTDVILKNQTNQMIFNNGRIFGCYTSNFSLAGDNGDGKYNYDSTPPDGGIFAGSSLTFLQSDYIGQSFWTQGTKGFIGTDTFSIAYTIGQWINFSGSNVGDIEYYFFPASLDSGSINITYIYTPVPEPCAFRLIISGAALLIKKVKTKNI